MTPAHWLVEAGFAILLGLCAAEVPVLIIKHRRAIWRALFGQEP